MHIVRLEQQPARELAGAGVQPRAKGSVLLAQEVRDVCLRSEMDQLFVATGDALPRHGWCVWPEASAAPASAASAASGSDLLRERVRGRVPGGL